MTRSVLVPFDGSPLSYDALRHALEEFPDAAVTVLHVVDLFEPDYRPDFTAETAFEPMIGTDAWYAQAEEFSERLLEEAADLAAEHGREVTTTSEVGDPTRVVVDYADEEDVDHVVLGAHGRPDDRRAVFGTVAETVARRASVPVTLVR